jgi:hypothetical protein
MIYTEALHDHVRAAMLDDRTQKSLSPKELSSFSDYLYFIVPAIQYGCHNRSKPTSIGADFLDDEP